MPIKENSKLVSIIIPVYNQVDFTRKCFESIKQNTSTGEYEIIVVNNASTDNTQDYLTSLGKEILTVNNAENLGFVDACNLGAEKANGNYLLFLNNDTEVLPGWLSSLVEVIEQDEKNGVVGSKFVYPDGSLQEAGGIIYADGSGRNFGRFDDPAKEEYNRITEVDYITGACLMIRTNLFNKIGCFNKLYRPAYYEDTDLCFSARKLGYKVLYVPGSQIIHHEHITAGQDSEGGFKKYLKINHQKFVNKWSEELFYHEDPPEISGFEACTADRNKIHRRLNARLLGYDSSKSYRFEQDLSKMKYDVSVILAATNIAKLQKCLKAFTTQLISKDKFQIVIVESNDEKCLEDAVNKNAGCFNHSYVFIGKQSKASAINKGIELAKSKIVVIHSEDYLPANDYLEQHINFHKEHPNETEVVVSTIDFSSNVELTPFSQWSFECLKRRNEMWLSNEETNHLMFSAEGVSFKKSLLNYALFHPFYPSFIAGIQFGTRLQRFVQIKIYSSPWIKSYLDNPIELNEEFNRYYLEGRLHKIYQENYPKISYELFGLDLKTPEVTAELILMMLPDLLKQIQQAEGLLAVKTEDRKKLDKIKIKLFDVYKLACRFVCAQGALDDSLNIPDYTGMERLRKYFDDNYYKKKYLPKICHTSNRPRNVNVFKNPKKKTGQLEVLCFFPHNPYPPRTGCDQAFIGTLNALQELDCHLTIFGTTYYSDKVWEGQKIQAFLKDKDVDIYIYQSTEKDDIFSSLMNDFGKSAMFNWKMPDGLQKSFDEVFDQVHPDIVLINYAWWGKLIQNPKYSNVTKVQLMHDLVSFNLEMQDAAVKILGQGPYHPDTIPAAALDENVFAKMNLPTNLEEYEIYDLFDYTITFSEREEAGIKKYAKHTKAVTVPVPINFQKSAYKNTYSADPIYVIASNVFNIQGYNYFAAKILPLIKKRIPNFNLNIIGDGCWTVAQMDGIRPLGFVPDLEDLYAKSSFAIAPLIGGTGQSVKILEAMAHSLTAVALKNPYQRLSIQHGTNGFIATNAKEFADYVVALYTDRVLCKKFGDAAREYISEEFSHEHVVDGLRPIVQDAKEKRVQRLQSLQNINITIQDDVHREIEKEKHFNELLKSFKEKEDGHIVILKESLMPLDDDYKSYENIRKLLDAAPPFYVHMGGAGDALLLLSTFYDEHPDSVVISIANNTEMLHSFFKPFNKLKRVIIFSYPQHDKFHRMLRKMLYIHPNFLGMGITPPVGDYTEWNAELDIEEKYGVNTKPMWCKQFEKGKITNPQIVLQPVGSQKGMTLSKRNIIHPVQWVQILNYLIELGIKPVVVGTPKENKDYPLIEGCIDKRSFNFEEQMNIIAAADLFIGADSWGKSFSALCGIETIVFPAIVGSDLNGWKDHTNYVFIDPWERISVVNQNFGKLFNTVREKLFPQIPYKEFNLTNDYKIIWEGSQFVNHSLSVVNREVCLSLIKDNYDVSIVPFEPNQYLPDVKSEYYQLLEDIKLPNSKVDIHVRHHWPPNLNAPTEGRWVVWQPWEFGSIPTKWANIFSKQVDEMWVPSNFVRNVFIDSGVPADRVYVIPSGIDPKIFNPNVQPYKLKTKKKFKFLFVGGTIFRKGIDILLKAYTETFNSADDVCLVVKDFGGDSFYAGQTAKEKIKSYAKNKSLPEIEYIDSFLPEKEIAGLYKACNVLVHPYRGEGFGLPILESMACGTTPIVTNAGACLDFCNKDNSILVDAKKLLVEGNTIGDMETVGNPYLYEVTLEDLISKMKYAIEHTDHLAKLGKQSAEDALKFSWENTSQKVKERIVELKKKLIIRFEEIHSTEKTAQLVSTILKYFSEGKFEKVIQLAAEAENTLQDNLNGSGAETLCTLENVCGLSHLQMNNIEDAKKCFETALGLNPASSLACVGLGEIFFIQEQYDNAKVMFEWGVKNEPNNPSAVEALSRANVHLGLEEYHNTLVRG